MTMNNIMLRAIHAICNADFSTIYEYTRQNITIEDMENMYARCDYE